MKKNHVFQGKTGFHYQSDIEAGRVAGSITFARLCSDAEFQEMLKAATLEFQTMARP